VEDVEVDLLVGLGQGVHVEDVDTRQGAREDTRGRVVAQAKVGADHVEMHGGLGGQGQVRADTGREGNRMHLTCCGV
jgi:hypothetical protein